MVNTENERYIYKVLDGWCDLHFYPPFTSHRLLAF